MTGSVGSPIDERNEELTISVVVCAYTMERFDQTCRCVASILAGDRHPEEVLLIVDENPMLRERLREVLPPEVRVFDSDGHGISDARTMALRIAIGSVVAFIDDDAWADPSWLSELSSAFQDADVLGAGGRVEPDWEDASAALPPEIYWVVGATYRGHRTDAGPISRPLGCNMAVRREVFLTLGGFPSAFGSRSGAKMRLERGTRDVHRDHESLQRRVRALRPDGSSSPFCTAVTLYLPLRNKSVDGGGHLEGRHSATLRLERHGGRSHIPQRGDRFERARLSRPMPCVTATLDRCAPRRSSLAPSS